MTKGEPPPGSPFLFCPFPSSGGTGRWPVELGGPPNSFLGASRAHRPISNEPHIILLCKNHPRSMPVPGVALGVPPSAPTARKRSRFAVDHFLQEPRTEALVAKRIVPPRHAQQSLAETFFGPQQPLQHPLENFCAPLQACGGPRKFFAGGCSHCNNRRKSSVQFAACL